MNQIPNIGEEDVVEALLEDVAVCLTTTKNCVRGSEKHFDFDKWREKLHQQLQKAHQEGIDEAVEKCNIRIKKEAKEHVKRKIAHGKAMYEKGKKERD